LAEDESIEKEQIIAALDEIKGDMQTKIRSINILRRRFYSKADHYKRRGDNLTEYLLGVLIHRLGD
jgi:DNA-binding NtrC family response regulator